MRATVMHNAGDVRIENVPDAKILNPTDAVLTVTRACICGSDLWPYKFVEHAPRFDSAFEHVRQQLIYIGAHRSRTTRDGDVAEF